MAYNPGVSFFIPFYELDPSTQNQCIFFTQKGERCRWHCQQSDNMRAITLHKGIMAMPSEAVSLDLLRDYVLCNCCRSGRARHRDRIEDVCLLLPLAQRWQVEIWTSGLAQITKLYTPPASPSDYRPSARTSFSASATPSTLVASSSSYQYGSPGHSDTVEASTGQPRYNLRSCEADASTKSTSNQPPLSEFRAHIADPLPSDSVSWKILEPLEGRDFETGSLYIFDRASSPGHVKIGWTANSVSRRLDDWSKCGYKPNLLFSVHHVPHAQRAETFAHHELLNEWRRERQCKVCGKSHQEWFEVDKERAAQVLGDWADFMKIAEPYDSEGWLENRWKEIIEMMDGNGEAVTAKKLLKRYEASLVEEVTLAEELLGIRHAPKIEQEVRFKPELNLELLEAPKEEAVRMGSPRIKLPTLPKENLQFKSEALPTQFSLLENLPLKAENQPEGDPPFKRKPTLKTEPLPTTQFLFRAEPPFKIEPVTKTASLPSQEFLFRSEPAFKIKPVLKTEPPPSGEFLFKSEPPFKIELVPKTEPLLETKSLFKMEPLPTSEVVHKEVPVPDRTVIKKELPAEQILFPSSPLLQFTTPLQGPPSLQGIKTSQSTGTEENSPMHTITNSDGEISILDTSSNPKINPSVSNLAAVSLSVILAHSATLSEDISYTNTDISTNAGTNITKSSPVSSLYSSPESDSFDSSTTTSASPRPKIDPASNPPAQQPGNDNSETSLSPSTDDEPEAEVVDVQTSVIMTCEQQRNIVDDDFKARSESGILGRDVQSLDNGMKTRDRNEITASAAEDERGTETETETGSDGWDADETLVEDQGPGSLEEMTLKIVDEVCDEISSGKLGIVLKGLNEAKVLEYEAPSGVEAAAKA